VTSKYQCNVRKQIVSNELLIGDRFVVTPVAQAIILLPKHQTMKAKD